MKDRVWSYDANRNIFSMTFLPLRKVLQAFMGISAAQTRVHSIPHPSLAPAQAMNSSFLRIQPSFHTVTYNA